MQDKLWIIPQSIRLIENQSLKNEFKIRGLDLDQIWELTPNDPEQQTRQFFGTKNFASWKWWNLFLYSDYKCLENSDFQ